MFLALLAEHPDLSWHVHRMHSREVLSQFHHMSDLGAKTARQRLERVLRRLATLSSPNGTGEEVRLLLPLKRWELASLIAVTPEHLSRLLKRLREDGVIRVQQGLDRDPGGAAARRRRRPRVRRPHHERGRRCTRSTRRPGLLTAGRASRMPAAGRAADRGRPEGGIVGAGETVMRRLGLSQGRWRPDVAVVLVPLLAILVLQYLSSRRLAEVELIAHQTTIARYLDAVTADVRQTYENAAQEMLDVPGDVLAAKRFDDIARHFDSVDTSTARLLFATTLDGCLCLTRYFDPAAGTMSIGAEPDVEVVVLRASTLLRLRQQQWLDLDVSGLDVDEADPANRVGLPLRHRRRRERHRPRRFVLDTDRFEASSCRGQSPRGWISFPAGCRTT